MSEHDFDARSIELNKDDQAVFAALTPMLSISVGAWMEQKQRHDHTNDDGEVTEIEMQPSEAGLGHFSLLSERLETMCVVLRNGAVLYLAFPGSNSHHHHPVDPNASVPSVILRRLEPTSFSRSYQGSDGSEDVQDVTAASLLPLDLAFACRVDLRRTSSSAHTEEPTFTHLRGMIGCSNGRVSVFSERGYAFSFAAHDSPVTNVAAIYCHHDEPQSPSCASSHIDDDSPRRRGAVAVGRGPRGVGRQSLMRALQHVGFVTEGLDGQIVIWRRGAGMFEPRVVVQPGLLTRHIAFSVYTPRANHSLLHPYSSAHAGEPAPAPQLRPSMLIRSTSTMQHGIHISSVMDYDTVTRSSVPSSEEYEENADRSRSSRYENVPSSASAVYDKRDLHCWGREADFGSFVHLPGGTLVYTTAMAGNEEYGLVARERQLYAVDYATHEVTLVMTASRKITHIELHRSFATVWSSESGSVYVLQVRPFAVLGRYRSARHRRLLSCSVDPRTLIMTLVGVDNTVEVVRLPESYRDEMSQAPAVAVGKSRKANYESPFSAAPVLDVEPLHRRVNYGDAGERVAKQPMPAIPSEPMGRDYERAMPPARLGVVEPV